MTQYIIGVDAGGSKTHAALYDLSGNLLFQHYTGMGNMNVDAMLAIKNIKDAIKACLDYLCVPCYICIGAAGITAKGNKETLYDELQKDFPQNKINIVTDALLALYASLEGKDGILLISGTGSIGYAKQGNSTYRVGGWGHIVGDNGSGYAIALEAIKTIFRDYDSQRPMSELSIMLMEKIGAKSIYDVVEFVYHNPKSKVASLFKDIMDMANKGDGNAIDLLKQGADELEKIVQVLLGKTTFNKNVNIAFAGSVILQADILQKRLLYILEDMEYEFNVKSNNNASPKGAYYLYKEQC